MAELLTGREQTWRGVTEPRSDLKCDVCGKPPWWSLSREGDPCPDDDGHLIPADREQTRRLIMSGDPFPKAKQLARGERRYRRKVASPKQWQAIQATKCTECRVCGANYTHDRALIEAHHLIPRDYHGDDVSANIVGLCGVCHRAVEARAVTQTTKLLSRLTDAEYAYAVDKLGEAVWERVYGIEYQR